MLTGKAFHLHHTPTNIVIRGNLGDIVAEESPSRASERRMAERQPLPRQRRRCKGRAAHT
jgi:hypothetical protein